MRAPSGPAVGAYVYAKDKKGYWYRAKVLAERGGNQRSFFVHFQGFRSNHDEWVPKARIRQEAVWPKRFAYTQVSGTLPDYQKWMLWKRMRDGGDL